ncbi:MAG: PQQ-binding-like beta-propeller repeat protein [Deltaproteobacteria bacterium]|nr:PQQ-binding-like beta-propeller repeat protein [Deltaproteobacteria bacterium]
MSKQRSFVVVAAAAFALFSSGGDAASSPEARQVYSIVWTTPVVETRPCLLSVVLPPSEKERCSSWTRRESGGAAFHDGLGVVVVGGSDRLLHGLDGRDGKKLWETETPGAVVSQPVLVDDGAYVGTDDARVLRVDVTSGHKRWETSVDAEVTEPVVIEGDVVFVVTGADSTYALNRLTGEALWVQKHPLPRGITLRGQGKPLVVDVATGDGVQKRLYVGHADGRLSVLDRETGAPLVDVNLSQDDSFGDLDADPILHKARGGTARVIVASHTRGIIAVDPRSNTETWRTKEPGIVRLASGGEPMLVAAGAGKVLGLDAETGQIRWRFTWPKGAPTRIAVKGGRVHIGSDRGAVYVLDLFSGRPLQYAGSGTGTAADLALWHDMMFVTSTAGNVTALSNAWVGGLHSSKAQDRSRRWP